jgi:hypothetical protein
MEGHQGYRFGDITRMVIHWLGPHARAVRYKLDWLKFGKAVVIALMAGQTINLGVVCAALTDSVKDPQMAVYVPAITTVLVYLVEQGRRLVQGTDAHEAPVPEEVH